MWGFYKELMIKMREVSWSVALFDWRRAVVSRFCGPDCEMRAALIFLFVCAQLYDAAITSVCSVGI